MGVPGPVVGWERRVHRCLWSESPQHAARVARAGRGSRGRCSQAGSGRGGRRARRRCGGVDHLQPDRGLSRRRALPRLLRRGARCVGRRVGCGPRRPGPIPAGAVGVRSGRAPVLGGVRARFGGAGRARDPRSGARRLAGGTDRRNADPCPGPALPAGGRGGQTGPHRDRGRAGHGVGGPRRCRSLPSSGSTVWPGAGPLVVGARGPWPRSPRRRWRGPVRNWWSRTAPSPGPGRSPRTFEGAEAVGLDALAYELGRADAVVVATSVVEPVVTVADLASGGRAGRAGRRPGVCPATWIPAARALARVDLADLEDIRSLLRGRAGQPRARPRTRPGRWWPKLRRPVRRRAPGPGCRPRRRRPADLGRGAAPRRACPLPEPSGRSRRRPARRRRGPDPHAVGQAAARTHRGAQRRGRHPRGAPAWPVPPPSCSR